MTIGAATTPAEHDGFGGRLAESFPSQILMGITEVCNLACTHCGHPQFTLSPHAGARHLDPALNSKMVDEVRTHGGGATQYIRYAGNGEPLVHPQAYDMLDEAVRHSGGNVTLTTNGTIMNETRTTQLLDAGLDTIEVSIDAFRPETYARLRRNGTLDVTRGNIRRLIQWVGESRAMTKVIVSFVEQPENAAEAADFERFWTDEGADAVVIRRQHSCSGAMVPLADVRRGLTASVPRTPCPYPWDRVVVNALGDLAFCPSDWVHGSRLADYRETTIHDTWSGPAYSALRRAHLENDYRTHAFCGQCPDWEGIRWPHEGRTCTDLPGELTGEEVLAR